MKIKTVEVKQRAISVPVAIEKREPKKRNTTPTVDPTATIQSVLNDPDVMAALKLIAEADAAKAPEKVDDKAPPKQINLEDVMEGVEKDALISSFKGDKQAFKLEILKLATKSLAMQSAVHDTQQVIQAAVSPAIQMDLSGMLSTVERVTEIKYLELMLEQFEVKDDVKHHVTEQYVLRRWGPEPPKGTNIKLGDTTVTVDGKTQKTRGGSKTTGGKTKGPLTPSALGTYRT